VALSIPVPLFQTVFRVMMCHKAITVLFLTVFRVIMCHEAHNRLVSVSRLVPRGTFTTPSARTSGNQWARATSHDPPPPTISKYHHVALVS